MRIVAPAAQRLKEHACGLGQVVTLQRDSTGRVHGMRGEGQWALLPQERHGKLNEPAGFIALDKVQPRELAAAQRLYPFVTEQPVEHAAFLDGGQRRTLIAVDVLDQAQLEQEPDRARTVRGCVAQRDSLPGQAQLGRVVLPIGG